MNRLSPATVWQRVLRGGGGTGGGVGGGLGIPNPFNQGGGGGGGD